MRLIRLTQPKWLFCLVLTAAACLRVQAANLTGTTAFGNAFSSLGDPTCNAFASSTTPLSSPCGTLGFGSGDTAVIGASHPTFSGGGHDYDFSGDFTASSLTVMIYGYEFGAPGMTIISMTFQDPAFSGLGIVLAGFTTFTSASQFSFSLTGDTLSFASPGYPPEGDYTATVDFVNTPEPATAPLLLLALLGTSVPLALRCLPRRFGS